MAGRWRERPLAELTDNFDGIRVPVKEADRRPGPYPYYGASGVVDHVDNYLFDGEYLLIAEDGENLRTRNTPVAFLARGKFWVNNHAHIVRGNGEADTRFLMYALSAADISGYLTGSTMPKLTQGNLNRIPLLAPEDIDEQRAIAHILGTLDDKIELNRRMNETLEAMARALFKSWFVDFDPVRAKAEGRDPGLPKPLADLFPARLVDSELGEIPQGWEAGRFGDVVEQLREQENPLSFPDALFHHFSIPAFDEGQTARSEYGESIKSLKFRVPPGVILISKLNPEIERVWMVDVRPGGRAVCSTEFLVLRARPPFKRGYVYCLARSPLFRQQIEGLVTGTSKSHQRAQVESILNLAAVKPPGPIVEVFDRLANSLLSRTLECRHESRTLAALRDSLLPKLISGELRVDDAEKFVDRSV
jgi:type I restriction enzyme, S subunit